MIKVLSWNYEIGTDDLIDVLFRLGRLDSIDDLVGYGMTKSRLNRIIVKLKKDGLLSSFRYSGNNFIWCIGDDVENLVNAHDAIATARYRNMINAGGDPEWFVDATAEEQENMLLDVPVFDSDKKDYSEDMGFVYSETRNTVHKVEGYPVGEDLKEYVDALWSNR